MQNLIKIHSWHFVYKVHGITTMWFRWYPHKLKLTQFSRLDWLQAESPWDLCPSTTGKIRPRSLIQRRAECGPCCTQWLYYLPPPSQNCSIFVTPNRPSELRHIQNLQLHSSEACKYTFIGDFIRNFKPIQFTDLQFFNRIDDAIQWI